MTLFQLAHNIIENIIIRKHCLEVGIEPTGQHKEVKDKKDLALLAEIENISARLDFRHYVHPNKLIPYDKTHVSADDV
ncbi:unnamed protein product [Schistosoma mattheei]|uniref:Uncharacterized protein n=1 Tax=Schistosoma mattheei TaxID=31246 RepID=A0A183PXS6_9TREM|nr:unnamed protein product [Schistosoma mattheei]